MRNKHKLERDLFRDVCKAMIEQGFVLNVWYDDEPKPEFEQPGTSDLEKIMELCFDGIMASTDEWAVIVNSLTAERENIGAFQCVAGNDGYDLIADCSVSLNPIIDPITEKWEELYFKSASQY